MAIKDIPGITTMPKNERDWIKFILDLESAIETSGGGVSGDYVTLDTAQTITGAKEFTSTPTVNEQPVWNNDNVGTQINSLPVDNAPNAATAYAVIYDPATDAPYKVLLNSAGGGSSADDELLHFWFD